MRIEANQKNVSATGILASKEATVQMGPQLMKMLSGLYANPIDAVVREYLTNMWDAVAALRAINPTAKIPACVLHVPNALSTELVFEDFGIGMSFDTLWNTFTTYNKSTKNGSNNEVGGFGIGCKTAFCYNDRAAWTIESRYEGQKHILMACVGENSMPTYFHVSSTPTKEHSWRYGQDCPYSAQ